MHYKHRYPEYPLRIARNTRPRETTSDHDVSSSPSIEAEHGIVFSCLHPWATTQPHDDTLRTILKYFQMHAVL